MTPAVADAPARTGTFSEIEIEQITESTSNPRKRFGEIDELAQSIREQGVIEPLIVRPHAGRMHGYELVAGARRLRAARLAGLVDVPCLIRTLTDLQVLEIQVTENLQRKDVHPLEEADAYAALMQADHAYTVEAVAARVGRSTSYVYQRLKLKDLTTDAREAFETDEITAAHAVRLARLSPADQARGLDECFYQLFGREGAGREVAPVAKLDLWIADHTKVDVADRESVQHYLPELHAQLAEEPEPERLIALSTTLMPAHYLGTKDHGVLGQNRWKAVKSQKACPHTQRGVIVHGAEHQVLWVCAKKGCSKHWPVEKKTTSQTKTTSAPTRDYEAERKKAEAERARFLKLQPMVMAALAKTYATVKLTDDLVHELVEDFERDGKSAILAAGLSISVKHAGPIIAFLLNTPNIWNIEGLRAEAKKRKVDLKALEQRLDADLKGDAEMKASTTPTAKKPTTKKGGKK
jgi:ParB/RepB/Spo0J family partition protein